MSSSFPPRRSTPSAPPRESQRDNLESVPQPLTTFVGRDRDVAAVVELLRRPDIRLLTITGTGGVGKTRLALRAIKEVRGAFDGTVFVSLASVRDPEMLLPTVAHLLNVPDAPGQPLLSRLCTFLEHRSLLLVLDNLEHLLDAVPAVADLLAGCPRLTILCTCRTNLNVTGEHLLPLAPLPAEDARELFLERVRALMPGFTATDEVVPVIDGICDRLDRLPLALELAASRVPVLPPTALLARLQRRLDLLANGPRDAPVRQRGMREAIDWSHDLLLEEQRILFQRLGVFIGGFTLEAAEAVAGDGVDVLEATSALVAASLVVRTAGVADEPRYTMLETIWEYALEQLRASGEEAAVRANHADYYRTLAEDALPLYDGPEIRLACDRVEIELDNCRAAMSWALETGNAETGTRLAGALWRVWQFARAAVGQPWMDRVAEGRDWIEHMLAMPADLPTEALTEALIGAGVLARIHGDRDRARVAGENVLTRSRSEGYPYGEFWAIGLLGALAEDRGQFETARSYYDQGLTLSSRMRNPQNHLAIAYIALGIAALRSGDLKQAAYELGVALQICRETGNSHLVGRAAGGLANALREQGDFYRATALGRESVAAYVERGELSGVHASLVDIAVLTLKIGRPETTARLAGVASTFFSHPDKAEALAQVARDAQAQLGDAAFEAASQDGRRMAWDDVIAEIDALIEAIPDAPAPAPPEPAVQYGLSRREVEVLRQVTEGHSSRVIAETLSVSERTVETHVFHIFNKLSVNSPAAATAYAVRHGLV